MQRLSAARLRKAYRGVAVVQDVSLTVASGEVVGLLGPNGAGKTTTFYMIVGLVRRRRFDLPAGADGDADLSSAPMHERARLGIGYLPQEASVFRKLTVENVLAILETRGTLIATEREKADALLREFSFVVRLRSRKPQAASEGARRSLDMAMELAFVLLDEPFGST